MSIESPSRPVLSVVIVNYRSTERLRRCLASIACKTSVLHEVIVVDNASPGFSARWFREIEPGVMLVESPCNQGFAGGVNLGLRYCRGEYVALLNPDSELVNDALDRMVAFLRAHRRCGIAGARITYPPDAVLPDEQTPSVSAGEAETERLQISCGRFLTLGWLVAEHFGLRARFPRRFGGYVYAGWDRSSSRRVDWVSGSALCARRELLARHRGLDPRYFMYCEEQDLCFAAAREGWHTVFLADVLVRHYEGGSSEQAAGESLVVRRLLLAEFARSQWLFLRKSYGRLSGAGAKSLLVTAFALRAAKWLLSSAGGVVARDRKAATGACRRARAFGTVATRILVAAPPTSGTPAQ
ncbi:MAG: glycosyltransferase [Candidatus Schekmanbacteria bacterium]|nr:glycosyltransferase [Candidatus Schekmanbacteria bacterium]